MTKLGKELVTTAEKLKKTVLIPSLNYLTLAKKKENK